MTRNGDTERTTAIVTYKKCRHCGALAPVGWDMHHEPKCADPDDVKDAVNRPHVLAPGERVVRISDEVLQLDCGCRVNGGIGYGPGDEVMCEVHGDVEVADVIGR